MKIRDIKIENLFGRYNYNLHFNEDCHYLILTSPNGYGKTTILRIIRSLSTSDLFYFYWLSYKSIYLSFVEGAELFIESKEINQEVSDNIFHPDVPANRSREIIFKWLDPLGGNSQFIINERLFQKASRSLGYYEGFRIPIDNSSSKEYREFVSKNPRLLQLMAREQNNNAFLLQIKNISTVFIEAQRIFSSFRYNDQRNIVSHSDRITNIPSYTIDEIAAKICDTMKVARFRYLEYAQEKGNQLIYRLLSDNYKKLSEQEYNLLRSQLLQKIQELKQYGLIDGVDIPEYSEEHQKELSAHISEANEKLSRLDDTYNKVKLFSSLISRKNFTAKTISFSREKGLRVVADDQKWLALSDLSSGEQNIIIMLYYLVFEYNKNKLILIDEPEISLHVAWQYQYVDELEEILNLNDGQAIIATHSPQIIGERWDKCCDLTEQ